jgi:ABC-type transport system involved in multi-copper enzyme maturation permease subunit
MNSPAALYIVRWLGRDTFRQARASSLFWLMLAASAVFIVACLSVGVEGPRSLRHPGELTEFMPRQAGVDPDKAARSGVDIVSGEMSLGFGLFRVELGRDAEDGVRFLQLLLAGGVADTAGILLALLWTAGFVPSFLEPSSASVLLAKPAPRGLLLAGKFVGVLAFVAFQATVFIGGTWAALAARTGVWHPLYLLCIPVLLTHFAVFFSFSALLGVLTRSTLLSMLGSLLFWFACWSVNFSHLTILAQQGQEARSRPVAQLPEQTRQITSVVQLPEQARPWDSLVAGVYWVLPKPADLNYILQELVQSSSYFARVPALAALRPDAINPLATLATSVAFIAVVLAFAGRRLRLADY